ncbi:MAG: enoyl-CoA hydratase-related protein [Desulfobacterales bacterium]
MVYETITYIKERQVAVITLNRPQRRNAWNYRMRDEVTSAIEAITDDTEIRVLILTGAGPSFCSGADVTDLIAPAVEQSDIDRLPLDKNVVWIAAQLRNLEIPIIAAINGPAVGLGLSLALAADIRIASERATFSLAFIKRGFVPDTGATFFLSRLIGTGRACEFVFTGDSIPAEKAEQIGMVNSVVPHDNLLKSAKDLAARIAGNPPIAIKLAKTAIYRGAESDLFSQLKHELLSNKVVLRTEDYKEAMAAYMEKREPVFKGR